jgi:hypothetical protein
MKWTFVIQQKLKVAVLLGVIMAAVVLFNLILQKNISDINQSVTSIYNDRLIPATDLFHLSEKLYSRQLVIEKFLYRNDADLEKLRAVLTDDNVKMSQLTTKYEKTYLVDQESTSLSDYKRNVAYYLSLENQILALTQANRNVEAIKLYETVGRPALERTIRQLSDLSEIQSTVGSKLVSDSRGIVATSNFLSTLQMVLAIVIGGIITALIVSSKMISQPQAKFKWN